MGSPALVFAGVVAFAVAFGAVSAAQVPTEIHAEHRAGQTFLTWRELAATGLHYRVYRSHTPLVSSLDLAGADLLGEVDDRSSRNQGRSLATRVESTWIIAPGGAPLSMSQGLFVYTVEADTAAAFYAVTSVQGVLETKTLQPGANATTAGVAETPAFPEPVLQANVPTGQLWGHWVGNRATPFQPALCLWPSSGFNFLFEPGSSPGPHGMLVRLHAAGQTYAQGWPQRFEVQKDVDILALSDLQAFTSWSLWFGAHEKFPGLPAANTRVWNYTQQRVLWTADWMRARLGAAHDPERVYAIGGSMGAIGSMYLVQEDPGRFAAALCRNGLYDIRATDYKNPAVFQKLLGSFTLDLPTFAGIPVTLRTNGAYMANRDVAADWPVIRTINGRNDLTVGWMSAVELFQGLAAADRPAVHYFDERTHNPKGYWLGVERSLLTRTFQTRRDRPSLRFSDCTLDNRPGNGARLDGDLVGTINGRIDYDPLSASSSATALDFDVYVRKSGTLDDSPVPTGWARLTPRRTGPFHVLPGEAVDFTLREGATIVDEQLLYADEHGLVHTPLEPLSIVHRRARFEHARGAGVPTLPESATSATPEGATHLPLGTYGLGALSNPDEVDYWRVSLTAGEDVAIEVLAARRSAAAWNAAGEPPLVRILGPDGTAEFLRQDPLLWPGARQDLDFPHWLPPADGEYLIALSNEGRGGGAYALRASTKGTASLALELEPAGQFGVNDSLESAEPIVPGTMLAGHGSANTYDWYSFELTGDSLVSIELWMQRLGIPAGQAQYPLASVRLESGATVVSLDGQRLGDSGARLLRPAGTYFLGVLPTTVDGDYLLALEVQPAAGASEIEPNDTPEEATPLALGAARVGQGDDDHFSFDGRAGDRLEFELLDGARVDDQPLAASLLGPAGSGATLQQAPLLGRMGTMLTTTGAHVLGFQAAGPYFLRLADAQPARFESEPNDDPAHADSLSATGCAAGRIDVGGELDHFAFGAQANRLTRLELHGPAGGTPDSGHGSLLRPRLTIVDALGHVLASAEDSSAPEHVLARGVVDPRPCLTLGFAPAVGGTFFARIEDADGASGAARYYWLEVQ